MREVQIVILGAGPAGLGAAYKLSKGGFSGVTVLEQTAPLKFFGPFGFRSGREIDKLSNVDFKKGITGSPLITEHALSVLEVEVFDQVDLGTHTVFIGDVVNSEVIKSGRPLTYQYYHEELKGKSPPAAPTYEADAK